MNHPCRHRLTKSGERDAAGMLRNLTLLAAVGLGLWACGGDADRKSGLVAGSGIKVVGGALEVDMGSAVVGADPIVKEVSFRNRLDAPLILSDLQVEHNDSTAFSFAWASSNIPAQADGTYRLPAKAEFRLSLSFQPVAIAGSAQTLNASLAFTVVGSGAASSDYASGGGGCGGGPGTVGDLPQESEVVRISLKAKVTQDCVDADGDHAFDQSSGATCVPVDCDDHAPTCTEDCTTDGDNDGQRDCDDPCIDNDGDGAGTSNLTDGNTCTGLDCDDRVAICTADCTTDIDDDGRRDCDDPCIDVDEDGYGTSPLAQGNTCAGPDCDDAVADCTADCETDIDGDGLRDCDDACIDVDEDGYGDGPDCEGADCDDAVDGCNADCGDVDADDLRDCDADPCVDGDEDGYGWSNLTESECVWTDCDDTAALCTTDCDTNVDLDDTPDCRDDCLDRDQDGFGEGLGCQGTDCNDSAFLCTSNCEDLDSDGTADCAANCRDRDQDGFGEPPFLCDCGLLNCNDCDPAVPTCTVNCALDADFDGQDDCEGGDCTDVDGDGWSDCKDACIDVDGDGWGDAAQQNAAFIAYCDDLVAQGLPVHPHCAVRCAGDDCDDSVETGARCTENCTSDFDGDGVPDCADDCQDQDVDGYGVDIVPDGCLGPDCDEGVATCNTDCTSDADGDGIPNCRDGCVDDDGDGYGQGTCTGADCDDTEATCNVDCTTDLDDDGQIDCKDSCIDVDGDTYGMGIGCAGPDCDDTSEICNTACTDIDTDGIFDCKDNCIDVDHDTYGLGTGCAGEDCLEANVFCNVDCTDSDLDGQPDCAGDCIDADGDSYCANAETDPDCDDHAPTCWFGTHDCQTDADGDSQRDCDDLCIDFDGDNYGLTHLPAGTAGICTGTDCDEGYATCNTDCTTNLDADPYPDCRDTCIDPDNDGYGDGTAFGNTCLGGDCLVSGQHDPTVWAGHPELCDGKDDDCDGQTDEGEVAVDDAQLCENQQGVCQGTVKPATLCVSGQWQSCTALQYQQQHNESYAESETRCDGLDNDCDSLTDAADGELATDAAHDLRPCELQAGVCTGCNKPPTLCYNGAWQACPGAVYSACNILYQGLETTCNDNNNRDNDCDGRANCADADCTGQAGPPGPPSGTCEPAAEQTCSDVYDNDNDGSFDCADADCNGRACNDNNACTSNETCAYSTTTCQPGTELCCSNNLNDDWDGNIDCADSDCNGQPGDAQGHTCQYPAETTCNDNFDNDRDTKVDCADTNCNGLPGDGSGHLCQISESTCNDGFDNDRDGTTDCADSGCNNLPGPQGQNCEPAGEQTCNDAKDNDGDNLIDCADTNCNGRACNDSNACTGNDACGTPSTGCRPGTELCCSNNQNDDGDSNTDCADNDCNGQPGDAEGHLCQYQTESTCNDGFDNDRDTKVDCADTNCNGATGQQGQVCEPNGEQTCNDGKDNDGDGLTDCYDSTCNNRACNDGNACTGNDTCQYSSTTCRPGTETCCTDNIDNDGSGGTDCADSDCNNQPGDAQGHICQSSGETTCNDGFDNDRDSQTDCVDNGCNNRACNDSIACTTGETCQSNSCHTGAESCCSNNINDDGDSTTDCADSDCNGQAGDAQGHTCQPSAESTCNDNFDNDRDGATDCADSQCNNRPGDALNHMCQPSGETTCNDGFDNDRDNTTDCADTSCNGGVGPQGQVCQPSAETTCSDGFDNDGDTLVDCNDGDCNTKTCNDGNACTGGETCQFSTTSCRPGTETCCSNNTNDDGDSTTDCADTDCNGLAGDAQGHLCQTAGETTCNDGFDNDRDGTADCADVGCAGSTGPQGQTCEPSGELTCNDGKDNDGDGLTDCNDSQCNTRTCNDSVNCTTGDVCTGTTCAGTPNNSLCDDSRECTDNICNVTLGCNYPNKTNGTECGARYCEGLVWKKQTCQSGNCSANVVLLNCADSQECTNDTCSISGCANEAKPNGTECGTRTCLSNVFYQPTCQTGTCSGVTTTNCDDSQSCTTDSCSTSGGCSHANVSDGTECGTRYCAGLDWRKRTCASGLCSGDASVQNCDDSNACTGDSCTSSGCGTRTELCCAITTGNEDGDTSANCADIADCSGKCCSNTEACNSSGACVSQGGSPLNWENTAAGNCGNGLDDDCDGCTDGTDSGCGGTGCSGKNADQGNSSTNDIQATEAVSAVDSAEAYPGPQKDGYSSLMAPLWAWTVDGESEALPVWPMSVEDLYAEQFYGYDGQHSDTGYEAPGKLVALIWADPDGWLNLVLTLDAWWQDSSQGSCRVTLTSAYGGSVLVADDPDDWLQIDSRSGMGDLDWLWSGSDGAVVGAFDPAELCLTLTVSDCAGIDGVQLYWGAGSDEFYGMEAKSVLAICAAPWLQ